MPKRRTSIYLLSVCIIIVLVFIAGCFPKNFQQPVAKFQQNIEKSTGIISQYYNELNSYERDLYLEERLYNPELKVKFREKGLLTPLSGVVFSPDGIKARLDSLELIALYASRLAALSGSEAPAKFDEASQALGQNLENLGNTFRELAGKKDLSAQQYVGPITNLVALTGRMYLEARQEKALEEAIRKGAPIVNKIFNILEDDMGSIVKYTKITGTSQQLYNRVTYYNDNRSGMSFEKRQVALNDIKIAAQAYKAAIISDPSNLVQGMRKAHNSLVDYAKSEQKPKDLAELAAAMELFATRVEQAAIAIKQFPHN